MNLTVHPSRGLSGRIAAPANKSHSFRALVLAGLARGQSTIRRPADSGDWRRGVRALRLMGADVEEGPGRAWRIVGLPGREQPIWSPADVIDCGNSGLILRFFTAAAALLPGYTVLTGDESIRTIRPIGPLLEGLNQLGAWAVSTKEDGHAPVIVRGPLRGGQAFIDGPDSQFVSALLIAAAASGHAAELHVTNAGEKPWVGLTLHWLANLGVAVEHENFERYRVPAGSAWSGFDVTVPADWSAAMYPIVAALLTPDSEVTVTGIDPNDPQPDRLVLDVLRDMGGDIEIGPDYVTARTSRLAGRRIDCNDFIDQFMLLAVVGAAAEGTTELVNAEIARHKECDRVSEMARALAAMGAAVEERPDGLAVSRSPLRGAALDSRADHRMVMTLSVAGLIADGPSVIRDAQCVEKTFADYPRAMAGLGARFDVE
ncbi:MAG: 3-phosphoshikimate 1-carboxyvinyltransferase [Phycisphaerae bacterium]|nr:3-phosphoshikimate 1-carboxyvinyltransferase [Phycisphaerae bacterium]